jgi:predicted dehydrogenase
MDLTPEEKAIGRENFLAAIGSPFLRRDFLQKGTSAHIASGRGLGPYYFGYDRSIDKPLRVGVIGTGDEGSVLIGAINPDFIQVVAIADIRPYNVHRAFHGDRYSAGAYKARPGLLAKYGWESEDAARKRHVRVYEGANGDYRELLRNAKADGVEAVIIALPLHLHARAAIAAMKAKLHVLTEKLMGHSVHECKEMAQVAEAKGLHLATGHQRHYNILYDHAVYLIRQGLLGDVHYIRAQWHRGNLPGQDSWQQPMPKSVKPHDPLAEELRNKLREWRERLVAAENARDESGIARWRPLVAQVKAQIADAILARRLPRGTTLAAELGYQSRVTDEGYELPGTEELIRWRLWDRTGGGLMAELGSHQLDAASIFISAMFEGRKQHPINVSAMANRPLFPADRDVDDHVYSLFEFPAPGYDKSDDYHRRKKISVAYASINGNGFGGYGETVFGTEGTLILEREQEAMLYQTSATTSKIKVVKQEPDPKKGIRGGPKMEISEDGDPLSAAIGLQGLAPAERGYTEQLEHWAWCVRKNPDVVTHPEIQPRCGPKVALADAVIALASNLAARGTPENGHQPQTVLFQPEWFDPDRPETPEGIPPDVSRYA